MTKVEWLAYNAMFGSVCCVCQIWRKGSVLQIRLDEIHAGGNGPRDGARGRKSSLDLELDLVFVRALCYSKRTRTHRPDNVLIPVSSIQKIPTTIFRL